MKLFNAFQMVAIFAAAPFGIGWLSRAEFSGAGALFYVSCAAYVISFGGMVASVRVAVDEL